MNRCQWSGRLVASRGRLLPGSVLARSGRQRSEILKENSLGEELTPSEGTGIATHLAFQNVSSSSKVGQGLVDCPDPRTRGEKDIAVWLSMRSPYAFQRLYAILLAAMCLSPIAVDFRFESLYAGATVYCTCAPDWVVERFARVVSRGDGRPRKAT